MITCNIFYFALYCSQQSAMQSSVHCGMEEHLERASFLLQNVATISGQIPKSTNLKTTCMEGVRLCMVVYCHLDSVHLPSPPKKQTKKQTANNAINNKIMQHIETRKHLCTATDGFYNLFCSHVFNETK